MKKMIASCMAVAAAACLLTACGTDEESRFTAELTESSAETDTDSSQADTTAPAETDVTDETTATDTTAVTETTTTVKQETESRRPYAAALEAYIKTMSEGDYIAIFQATYPSDVSDLLSDLSEEFLQELPSVSDGIELRLVEVTENGTLDMEAMQAVGVLYTGMYQALEYVKMYPDAEELPEELLSNEGLESIYDISRGYDITVTITADDETTEQDLLAIYVEGDGWKFMDNSLKGYVDASKQNMIHSTAKSIFSAANSALTDMDSNDLNVLGNYVICSDASLNKNLPVDFDLATFEKKLSQYFTAIEECEYIVVVNGGTCCTVVCMQYGESDYVGCYPANQIVQISSDQYDESTTLPLDENRAYTFGELYDLCTAALE